MMLSLQMTLICIQLLNDSVDSLKEVCRKGEDLNEAYEKLFDTMNSFKQLYEFHSSNNKNPM